MVCTYRLEIWAPGSLDSSVGLDATEMQKWELGSFPRASGNDDYENAVRQDTMASLLDEMYGRYT